MLLRAQAAQKLQWRSQRDPYNPACPLFALLRWHGKRYPDMPPPTEEVFNRDDWFAVLMDSFLAARSRWNSADITALTTWWNREQHTKRCFQCQACVPPVSHAVEGLIAAHH
jgi:hypothetical protein